MVIIRLSTYCAPGPKLRALPCSSICHNHAVIREVLSLQRKKLKLRALHRLSHSWEVAEARFEHTSVQAAILSSPSLTPARSPGAWQLVRQDGAQLTPQASRPWLSLPDTPLGSTLSRRADDYTVAASSTSSPRPPWHPS